MKTKKLLSLLLTLTMLIGLLPLAAAPALATIENNVEYCYYESTAAAIAGTPTVGTLNGVNVVESSDAAVTWSSGHYVSGHYVSGHYVSGHYVVKGANVVIKERITVSGSVILVLADGAKLTAEKGIAVNFPNSLVIVGQSEGTGQLVADAGSGGYNAGIGGDSGNGGGIIIIHGGKVTATGRGTSGSSQYGGAGIGGGSGAKMAGLIEILGGEVTAYAGPVGAAIGGGFYNDGEMTGSVIIYGGTVNATCTGWSGTGAGIGSGWDTQMNGTIEIHGGHVTASTITKSSGSTASGIGAGSGQDMGGTILITGGIVNAASS